MSTTSSVPSINGLSWSRTAHAISIEYELYDVVSCWAKCRTVTSSHQWNNLSAPAGSIIGSNVPPASYYDLLQNVLELLVVFDSYLLEVSVLVHDQLPGEASIRWKCKAGPGNITRWKSLHLKGPQLQSQWSPQSSSKAKATPTATIQANTHRDRKWQTSDGQQQQRGRQQPCKWTWKKSFASTQLPRGHGRAQSSPIKSKVLYFKTPFTRWSECSSKWICG